MTDGKLLSRTALYEAHLSCDGKMVPFGGWEMPIQYAKGILTETRSVRSHVGMFDVSHMGRIEIKGKNAADLAHWIVTQDILGLDSGRARYSLLCTEDGGILDDVVIYRLETDHLLMVCNAANRFVVWEWLTSCAKTYKDVSIEDITTDTVMIAVQGPNSVSLIESVAPNVNFPSRPFTVASLNMNGFNILIGRTGYTGENGFEIIAPAGDGLTIWNILSEAGAFPCGLGSRDILRLEASLLLHGNDIGLWANPVEAGLERFVDFNKQAFIGMDAIRLAKTQGSGKRLIGFVMQERGIARATHSIFANEEEIGVVTSGGYSPTLDKSIGLGYVPIEHSRPGTELLINVRGKFIPAIAVTLPFYSKKRQV